MNEGIGEVLVGYLIDFLTEGLLESDACLKVLSRCEHA